MNVISVGYLSAISVGYLNVNIAYGGFKIMNCIKKNEYSENRKTKKTKIVKRIVAMMLTLTMLTGYGVSNCENASKVNACEKHKNYIIQTSSDKDMEKTLEKYDKIETVAESIDDSLKQENLASVALTKSEVDHLKKGKNIVAIERDNIVKAAKAEKVKKIKLEDIDLEWNRRIIRSNFCKLEHPKRKVKIAVLDSGVDWGNDIELEESVTLVPGEEEMNPLFMDGSGHGNSVAGLIAAKDNDEGITGINPRALIYSVRVLDDNNEAPLSRVIDGIYYAIRKNVDIINMSFGLDSYSEVLKDAVDAAEKAGILVVAAAGNTGKNGGNVQYPAAYDNVLGVGSVDSEGELAETSAKGEQVDIVAPGELVCSTGEFGDLLVESGTSLAAPQVAAVASKIMEEKPNASSEEVRNAIVNGANKKTKCGYGLLDEMFSIKEFDNIANNLPMFCTHEIRNINQIENKNKIEFLKVNLAKGSWTGDDHVKTIGDGHANVKKGARYPDTDNSGCKGLEDNPNWHGGYKSNYVSAYIFATKMANDLGEKKDVGKTTNVSGLSYKEKMVKQVKNISWKTVKLSTPGEKRAFVWGMALHALADVFAHSVYVYSDGRWNHLDHDYYYVNMENRKIKMRKDKYACADEVGEQFWPLRYKNAVTAVNSGIKRYDKKNAGSHDEFSSIKQNKKTYKLKSLKNYLNAYKSESGKSYADYSY